MSEALKISWAEVRDALMIAGVDPVPMNQMIRSFEIGVPVEDFLRNEWMNHWNAYRASRKIEYYPGAGECEWFAKAAEVESYFCTRASFGGKDVAGFVIQAGITIPAGATFLGGITDGGHATCLIPVRTGEETFEMRFWEPQLKHYETMDVETALGRGIRLLSVGL